MAPAGVLTEDEQGDAAQAEQHRGPPEGRVGAATAGQRHQDGGCEGESQEREGDGGHVLEDSLGGDEGVPQRAVVPARARTASTH